MDYFFIHYLDLGDGAESACVLNGHSAENYLCRRCSHVDACTEDSFVHIITSL